MPKVSIIIPCYNHGKYLDQAIQSVFNQTYSNYEIIVLDDGSDDNKTKKIIKHLKNKYKNKTNIKFIYTENKGLPSARNTAIEKANGKFILPLDADDKIAAKFLEKCVSILIKDDNIGIVATYVKAFGYKNWKAKPKYKFSRFIVENQIPTTALFKKKDWEKVNGYNANMKHGWEDYDFWLSILELNKKIKIIPEILFFYRQHFPNKNKRPFSSNSIDPQKELELRFQIFENHNNLYQSHVTTVLEHIHNQKYQINLMEKQNQKHQSLLFSIKHILSLLKKMVLRT